MANINLLPWREQYREEKKQEFLVVLGVVFGLSLAVAFGWISVVNSSIESQQQRNGILQREITVLEKQVAEIQELKRQRAELIDRMKVIQDLQGTRPVIVRYFDEMVRAVPDGVYLTSLVRKGNTISLKGVAESNNRVSSLMRNLDKSDWFTAPNLTSVKEAPEVGEQANAFEMTVTVTAPGANKEEV